MLTNLARALAALDDGLPDILDHFPGQRSGRFLDQSLHQHLFPVRCEERDVVFQLEFANADRFPHPLLDELQNLGIQFIDSLAMFCDLITHGG